jgi:hypothetical protein
MITSILVYVSVFGLNDHCSLNMAKPLTPTLIGCIFLMNPASFNFFSISDVSRGSIVPRFLITFQLLRAFVTPFFFYPPSQSITVFSTATLCVGSRIITGFLPNRHVFQINPPYLHGNVVFLRILLERIFFLVL